MVACSEIFYDGIHFGDETRIECLVVAVWNAWVAAAISTTSTDPVDLTGIPVNQRDVLARAQFSVTNVRCAGVAVIALGVRGAGWSWRHADRHTGSTLTLPPVTRTPVRERALALALLALLAGRTRLLLFLRVGPYGVGFGLAFVVLAGVPAASLAAAIVGLLALLGHGVSQAKKPQRPSEERRQSASPGAGIGQRAGQSIEAISIQSVILPSRQRAVSEVRRQDGAQSPS